MTSLTSGGNGRRSARKGAYMLLTTLTFVPYAASLIADLLFPVDLFWLTALMMVMIFVGAVGWARSLDEGAMSAHYIAWYWGGSLGLAISALTYIALMPMLMDRNVSIDALIAEWLGLPLPNAGFHAGFLLALMPAVLGYVGWWVLVWVRRGGA